MYASDCGFVQAGGCYKDSPDVVSVGIAEEYEDRAQTSSGIDFSLAALNRIRGPQVVSFSTVIQPSMQSTLHILQHDK